MFSPKIKWTLALFFTILLLGIGFQEWVFLISLIPLIILSIFYFFTTPPEKLGLEIIRELDQNRFQEGEHIEISLRIRNKGKQAIDMLEIIDILPKQVSLKNSSNHIITSLDVGEETEFRYVISCDYRGRWKLGPTHVRARNFIDSARTPFVFVNEGNEIAGAVGLGERSSEAEGMTPPSIFSFES